MIARIVQKRKDGVLLYKAASKLLIAILVVSFLAVLIPIPQASAVAPTITRVQGPTAATVTTAGITSFLVTLPETPTQGNVIVAIITCSNTRNVTSITQTGVTWAQATSSTINYNKIDLWYGIVGVSPVAAANITMTGGIGEEAGFTAIMCEYSGLDTVNPLDQTSNSSGNNINGYTGITEYTYPYVLAVGGVVSRAHSASSPTNNFTLVDTDAALITYTAYLEKTNNPAYGTQLSSNVTLSGSTYWAGCIATFKAASYDYLYTFNGIYDENIGTGVQIGEANVTAYFDDGTSPVTFAVGGTVGYSPATRPLYFYYNIWEYANTTDTALHREYWLSEDETNGTYNIYADQQGLTDIVFTIRALGGAGLGSYVTVQRNIDGTLRTVEKRPVDSTGTVVMSLQAYTLYSVGIEGTEPNTSTTFGNINTYTTPIVLTVSALSFPSNTLQQYRYLRIWASRPTSTEIRVNYQDTNLQTVSVEYEIVDGEGVSWYNYTHVGENSFSDIWVGANSNTTYYLRATVVQSTFGTSTFNQVLARDGATSSPIDLSFLGSWTFNIYGSTVTVDSTQVFWAIVVLIVFGSFSVLNAYVGAFAGVASAAILVWLGWLNIPAGAIALAFAFTVVIGIAVYKRRGN